MEEFWEGGRFVGSVIGELLIIQVMTLLPISPGIDQMKSVCSLYQHQGWVFLRGLVNIDDWDTERGDQSLGHFLFQHGLSQWTDKQVKRYLSATMYARSPDRTQLMSRILGCNESFTMCPVRCIQLREWKLQAACLGEAFLHVVKGIIVHNADIHGCSSTDQMGFWRILEKADNEAERDILNRAYALARVL